MSDSLSKVIKIVFAILLTVSLILIVWFFAKTSEIDSELSADVQIEQFGSSLEYLIDWTYLLLIVAVGGGLLSTLKVFTNWKSAKQALVYVGVTVVMVGVSYMFSSGELLTIQGYTGTDNNPATLKMVDTGIIVTYFLFAMAGVSILYAEISKMFK
ncbi:MAG: hypothetical protein RIS47_608 [Bacteroidota bacterium]|jgi:hypothetical protein